MMCFDLGLNAIIVAEELKVTWPGSKKASTCGCHNAMGGAE